RKPRVKQLFKVPQHLPACVDLQKSCDTFLDFEGRSNRKHARLLQNFSSMDSVTICTHLQFDPKDFGFSAIFSYSTPSYLNEFQLRANLTRGKHVQLALLVHGVHGPYLKAFDHDDLWHSVCVSWSHNEGRWALHTDGVLIAKGEGLNATDSFGPGGLFIIGQEQDTYGGSFKADESFSGSITELHIWNRVLNSSEIAIMEKKCSPPSLGLFLCLHCYVEKQSHRDHSKAFFDCILELQAKI
uniref:Pentraxin family member n=1 Tax=Gouania willdenowi TaxID=441366 RepID=A0A8C5DP05_GOUWI